MRSYENPALVIGQAYLTHYGDHCIALLPTHVATEAKVPAFLSEGTSQLGEADEVSDLGDDLSVAQVTGSIAQDCGNSISTISRAIGNLVRSQGLATLRSVNSDGTLANLSVAVVDNDGKMFLRVRPTNDKIQIRKGHSGSLLMVGDRPVGMLLAVNARHGVGKVLRFDALLERAESYMAKRKRTAAPGKANPVPGKTAIDLAAAANGGSVSGWNTLPVDADHRPANLVGAETALHWRAKVENWPAEIELDLAGEKVIISRIELDGARICRPLMNCPGGWKFLSTSAATSGAGGHCSAARRNSMPMVLRFLPSRRPGHVRSRSPSATAVVLSMSPACGGFVSVIPDQRIFPVATNLSFWLPF